MLTETQRQLAGENHNLIYAFLHEKNLSIDDWYDTAAIGLCKAAGAYDPSRGKFTTIAYRCMYHEVCKEMRMAGVQKRTAQVISYNEMMTDDGELTHEGTLVTSRGDPEEAAACNAIYDHIARLRSKERVAILLTVAGYLQDEIAEMVPEMTNQVDVSRALKSARRRLTIRGVAMT